MKVAIPPEVTPEWQSGLGDWGRRELRRAVKGEFFRTSFSKVARVVIVVTPTGFDVVGLRRVACFDGEGREIPDAWAVEEVAEVRDRSTGHGDFERKYTVPGPSRRSRSASSRRALDERWGKAGGRRIARRWRRERRRERRERARMEARLAQLIQEQQDWIGHPTSFPHYDEIADLQQELATPLRED